VCRYAVRQEKVQLAVLSTEDYGKLSSEVNLRLYLLNRQLSQILSSEERRP
jgi:hypothetical protein